MAENIFKTRETEPDEEMMKAAQSVLDSDIDPSRKMEFAQARKYAEGRGLSIKVDQAGCLDDVRELIRVKGRYGYEAGGHSIF